MKTKEELLNANAVPKSVVEFIKENKEVENRVGEVFDIVFTGIYLVTTVPEEYTWIAENQELFAELYLAE